ncbi:unnamed protein product [Arabidopsis thaliana]|uniref:(thale cress) hypothetical protein n=1 Tax=Arabidopsis thaliana TaxID=3702 RepID=A0A7G2DT96_ARATH|nr:unnamed protein product [Arabidopsis thaliana]
MGDVELPKRLFRLGSEPEGRKRINNYFTLRWIEIIKAALDQNHLKQLEGSQFGFLLQMGTHQFSVMFLHYILSRQLVTDKKYEMWWVFAGKPIRFAIDDFALVTGLNCSKSGFNKKDARTRGKMKAVQNPTRFYKALFGKERKPTSQWIVGKLSMGEKYKDPLTRFRLSLLLLVDGILCPTCSRTIIDPDHVEMVKDVESFLKYPWGRTSFLATIRSAKQRTAKELAQDTTAIQGFPHALVLVTVACCPAIIYTADSVFNILDPTIPVEKLVQYVLGLSLNINVHDARTIDQSGMDRVTSLLNEELLAKEIDLSFSDEEDDEEVSHLLSLIMEEHPFEHNSWSGGVDATDVEHPSEDEFMADDCVNQAKGDGDDEMDVDGSGVAAEEREECAAGEGVDGLDGEANKDGPVTDKDGVSFADGEGLQQEVPRAGEMENNDSGSAGHGLREAVIKEVADEFEKRVLKIQQSNNDELKSYFEAELVKQKKELVAILTESVREAVSGLNRQAGIVGECSKCVADAHSKQDQRRADQPGNKHGVSQQVEPNIGLSEGSDNLPAACDINVGVSVPERSNPNTRMEVREEDSIQKGGKKKSCSQMDAQSNRPLNRTKDMEHVASTKLENKEVVHEPKTYVSPTEKLDDEVDIVELNFSLGLTQEINDNRSRLPPRGKKKTFPSKVSVLRSSNRIRDRPIQSNSRENMTSIPVQPHQTASRGAGKSHVSSSAKVEKQTPNQSPAFIGPFKPFSVPSPSSVKRFLKQMERGVSYVLADGVVLENTEFLNIFEGQTLLDESGPDLLVRFIQLRLDKNKPLRFDFLQSSFLSELRRQYNKFVGAADKSAFYFSTLARVPFMVRPKWFVEIDVIYCPMQVEKYVEHITIMLPYLIRKHGVNGYMLTQRLEPMTVSRPKIQCSCSSLGLVGIASVVLLELHSVNAMEYCGKLDDGKMRDAAKQYAIETFNALSPTERGVIYVEQTWSFCCNQRTVVLKLNY